MQPVFETLQAVARKPAMSTEIHTPSVSRAIARIADDYE